MTIHYHGSPISPRSVLYTLAGRCFCVSFAAPQDVSVCHQLGQSVMLDNGAFSFWRAGKKTDWDGYYEWCRKWLVYPTTWAVIPDVIDGSVQENDALIEDWPFGDNGAPVWHLHESIDRLLQLTADHHRVCFGSSKQYATIGTRAWHERISKSFNAITKHHRGPMPWLHMLRGMSLSGSHYPFASVDSTDVARNHNRPQNTARTMAERWDALQCPATWEPRSEQIDIFAEGEPL